MNVHTQIFPDTSITIKYNETIRKSLCDGSYLSKQHLKMERINFNIYLILIFIILFINEKYSKIFNIYYLITFSRQNVLKLLSMLKVQVK